MWATCRDLTFNSPRWLVRGKHPIDCLFPKTNGNGVEEYGMRALDPGLERHLQPSTVAGIRWHDFLLVDDGTGLEYPVYHMFRIVIVHYGNPVLKQAMTTL